METPARSADEQSATTRLLLACGIIGPLLNTFALLALGATRPGYNAWLIPDSNLELEVEGWMQIANYLVTGALLLGFAIGLRRVLRTGRGSTWGPILLGVYGLTFIGLAIFVTDPVGGYPSGMPSTPTIHGTIHTLFGQLQFISLTVACFVLAPRGAADPARHGWTRYSIATGLLIAASDVAFILTFKLLEGGPVGLISRIGIISGCGWIVVLAIRLMSNKAQRVSVEKMGLI